MKLTIFEVLGRGKRCSRHDGELDLFKRLALDAGALREPFLGLLENLTLVGN